MFHNLIQANFIHFLLFRESVTDGPTHYGSFRERPRPKPSKMKTAISLFSCYIIKVHILQYQLTQVLTNGKLIMYLKSAPLPYEPATCQKLNKIMFHFFMLKCTLIKISHIHYLYTGKAQLSFSCNPKFKSQL